MLCRETRDHRSSGVTPQVHVKSQAWRSAVRIMNELSPPAVPQTVPTPDLIQPRSGRGRRLSGIWPSRQTGRDRSGCRRCVERTPHGAAALLMKASGPSGHAFPFAPDCTGNVVIMQGGRGNRAPRSKVYNVRRSHVSRAGFDGLPSAFQRIAFQVFHSCGRSEMPAVDRLGSRWHF